MTRPNAHFFSFASEKTIVSGRVGPKTMKVVQYEIYCYSFPSSFIGIIIHFSKYIYLVYRHISTNFTMILLLLLAEKSIFATRNCF